MTTTYINAFQSTVNRDKFNFYLRDKNRVDQPFFQADSIHPSYLTHHVQTRKVQWINVIAPNVGDTVIVELAKVLQKQLTSYSHFMARLGGDEFCVVLKNIDQKKALEFFIKLKSAITEVVIQTKEIKELRMSVSIGVTFNDMNDLEEMINQADKALYVAKKNGRNRVEVA